LAAARGIVVGVVFGFFLWAGAIPAVRLLLVLT
jgi:hypothetical protein